MATLLDRRYGHEIIALEYGTLAYPIHQLKLLALSHHTHEVAIDESLFDSP